MTSMVEGPTRVLLVNAPPWKVVEPWYDTPRFARQSLAYLAAVLREHDGFEIQVVDAKLERIGFDEVVRRAEAFQPHLVGFTAFTNEVKASAHLARRIKARLPRATTLVGGVHVTALPEGTLREFPEFDLGCVGEGEETFVELCEALRCGTPESEVAGLVYRDGDRIVRSAERAPILDQNTIPFPAYDLFPKATEFWVTTQRGCPFTCKFCMNPNGRAPRQRSVENVMGELQMIMDRYSPEKLWFSDEIFSVDMERAHRLLDAMIAIDVPKRTKFWVESHVNFVDEDLFRHLKRAGCFQCGLGIETGNEAKLASLGKGTTLPMILEAFDAAKRAGLPVLSFFIIGQPDETVSSIRETIRLAVRLNPAVPIFGVMVPYPGTEVARLAARGEGGYRLRTTDWDEFNKQIGGALEFAGLTRWQIEWLQLSGYVKVFLYNGRLLSLANLAFRLRSAWLSVLVKIVRGVLAAGTEQTKGEAPEGAGSSGLAPTPDELAQASAEWQKRQTENLRHVKRFGDPNSMRVQTRRSLRVVQNAR